MNNNNEKLHKKCVMNNNNEKLHKKCAAFLKFNNKVVCGIIVNKKTKKLVKVHHSTISLNDRLNS